MDSALERMEPFRLGSLEVGRTRLTMDLRDDVAEDFLERFRLKTLRPGGNLLERARLPDLLAAPGAAQGFGLLPNLSGEFLMQQAFSLFDESPVERNQSHP